jgi:predicted RNA-binding protein with TRAM domain
MNVPDSLRCLFSATVERSEDGYVVSIPEHEVDAGTVAEGDTVRVGVFDAVDASDDAETASSARSAAADRSSTRRSTSTRAAQSPPVEEGEVREVEIESIGDQGDGIAKVERGFVVIVPGTDVGDTVEVEIDRVMENLAFATPVDEQDAAAV